MTEEKEEKEEIVQVIVGLVVEGKCSLRRVVLEAEAQTNKMIEELKTSYEGMLEQADEDIYQLNLQNARLLDENKKMKAILSARSHAFGLCNYEGICSCKGKL